MYLEGGHEFTAIVLDVGSGSNSLPVALLPTEVLYAIGFDLLCVRSPLLHQFA